LFKEIGLTLLKELYQDVSIAFLLNGLWKYLSIASASCPFLSFLALKQWATSELPNSVSKLVLSSESKYSVVTIPEGRVERCESRKRVKWRRRQSSKL